MGHHCSCPSARESLSRKPCLSRAYSVQSRYALSSVLSTDLLNPENAGGPGGSGVALVLGMGEALQQVVGGEFDVVGFDPR